MKKKDTNTFIKEVKNKYGNEYSVIGEYIKSNEKILIKHHKCGCEFLVTPNNFLRGRKCPNCFKSILKTTEYFKKELYDKYNCEYEVLGEYKNNSTKIRIKHNKCGKEFDILPTHILEKNRCPYCSGNFKKDKKYVNELLKDRSAKLLDEPMGMNKKTKCICENNHVFYAIPSNLLKGTGCPKCAGNLKYTSKTLEEKLIKNTFDNSYKILSIYDNGKVEIIHNKCGNVYKTSKSSIINGSGCPKCSASKGEKEIRKYLINNKINFEEQFKFDDCKNKKKLPFDFYLRDLNICIEYDGEGHYKPFRYKNALDKYKSTKINDEIKDTYCKERNIKLIRIPYFEFNNISIILKDTL